MSNQRRNFLRACLGGAGALSFHSLVTGVPVSFLRTGRVAEAQSGLAPTFLVLDLGLPDGSGLDVLKELRETGSSVPVVVLTARVRGADKVKALDLGADDYVTKPFWTEEVLARLRAVVRRSSREAPPRATTFRFGDSVLNLDAKRLTRGDEVIALTPTEYAILAYLAERLDRPVRRGQISDAVLEIEAAHESALQAHVSRLRKKLGDDAKHLQTVWGIGYRLSPGELV